MQNGANVLGTYGVSLEDTIGLMTAGVEVLGNGNKVGNGLKSIGINLAGIKTSAKTGELSLNKTAKALSTVAGIDIYSDKKKGEIKSMTQILDEVQGKWSSFTKEQKAGLSEAIAGKQQASVFQAIMQNYDAYKKLQGEFKNGDHFGSMESENSKFIDSIAGKINRLKETWISIGSTMMTSNFLKGALDGAIGFSEGLENIIKLLDRFKVLTPVLATAGMTFSKAMKDMSKQRRIEELRVANGGTPTVKTNLFSNMKRDITSATQGMSGLSKASKSVSTGFSTMGTNIKTMSSTAVSSIKTIGLSLLANLGMMALMTGAIMLISTAYKKVTSGVKDEAKALKEVASGHQENIDIQKNKLNVIKTTGAEYEKLRDKANKTAEEEAEMLRLGNELAEVMPNIKIGEDEKGNAIISMTKDMQGYAKETQFAIEQQNRLMLGTRLEQSDNALKMLTKGELWGKGLNEQKEDVQKAYDKKMIQLQKDYNGEMAEARRSDGKQQQEHMLNARKIRENMIVTESDFGNQYLAVQSSINEQSALFSGTMSGIWQNSASLLTKDLLPEMQSGIESFTSSMDFSQINTDKELDGVKRIFRELPKLAQDGTVNMETLNGKLSEINGEFAKTGNLKKYNADMKALAKTTSKETGWDAHVLEEMFTVITDGSLKSKDSLESFLATFGKTTQQIDNGDAFATALQGQFESISLSLDKISNHDFGSLIVNAQLKTELKEDPNLPKSVKDIITKMEKAGADDEAIITMTGEVLMALKDGKVDPQELAILTQEITQQITDATGKFNPETQVEVEAILKELGVEGLTKEIEEKVKNGKKVKKEIDVEVTGIEKAEQVKKAIELLESRPDVNKSVNAVVDGEEELIIFDKIIRNLPTDKTHTNKFIVDNAEALSKMETYEEVLAFIEKQPKEFKTKYGLETEGLEEGKKSLDEIDKKTQGEKVVKIKAPTDDVLKSIKDVETLIKYSSQIEKGKYKIEIDAKTQDAVDQLGKLEKQLKDVSNVMKKSPTMKFKSETAGASQNITGLINKINQAKSVSSAVKTVRFRSETALASQNITGLIAKIKTCQGLCNTTRTARFRAETAGASKNITGLIAKIRSVPTGTKTITYKVVTAYSTSGSPTSASKGAKVGGQSLSQPSEIISAPQVATSTPQVASPQVASTQGFSMSATSGATSGMASPTPTFTTSATQNTPIAILGGDISDSMKYDVNLLKELENRILSVGNALALLDKKMESAVGSQKIAYIKQQNALFSEQLALQKNLEDKLQRQKNYYQYFLGLKGFQFNSEGNFKNYEEKLIAMEKEKKRLEDIAESNSNKSSNYNGKNEKTKNNLEAQAKASKKASDDYNESLENTKKYLQEYTQVALTDLPKVREEYAGIGNELRKNYEEMREVDRTQRLFADTVRLKALNNQYDKIGDSLELISSRMDDVYGSDRVKLIDEQIASYKRQQNAQKEMVKSMQHEMLVYRNDLDDFGFKFDVNGDITNYEAVMKKFANSGSIEEITKVTDEYFKIYRDELPNAKKGISDLDKAIKDSAKEQLKTTKDMEDKIIEMKKQEIEDKKKLIDDDLKRETDALDKKKEAYNKMRKDMDYKDDLQEQKDALSELQQEISTAERDTSVSGQARLKELLDKQKEEQKKLEDMVQSNLDEQINNSIDEESKRLTDQAEKLKENLDNQYTDENLRKMAQDSLKTGLYKDINGEVKDLQTSLISFENEFREGLSAMGGLIKSELITNLAIAKDSIKDMSTIMNDLKLPLMSQMKISGFSIPQGGVSKSSVINFNQPLVKIDGNATSDMLPELKRMIDVAKDEITKDIVNKIK